jgi:tetratricopeptide (TPR) repeat protein
VFAQTRLNFAARSWHLFLFCLGALACAAPTHPLRAQKPAEPSASDGWTSYWTDPLTPREKALHTFAERLAAARKSRDFGPLLAEYEGLVRQHPDDLTAAESLMAIHIAMQHYSEALADLDRAASISRKAHAPELRFAILDYDRSIIHQEQHDYAAQAADLERALKSDQTSSAALNSLAWLRATNPDPALQNGDEAVRLAKRAVQSTGGRHFDELDTLAAAYAAQGKYPQAASLEKEAITLIDQDVRYPAKTADKLKDASARLALYTQNKPDRETPHDPTP